jgi:hypothetical protein
MPNGNHDLFFKTGRSNLGEKMIQRLNTTIPFQWHTCGRAEVDIRPGQRASSSASFLFFPLAISPLIPDEPAEANPTHDTRDQE